MSTEPIIAVQDLSKTFKLYKHPKHRLLEALHPLRKNYHHDYEALKEITFEVYKGDSVGILGKNGAGKSTLLKIITGVLTPSSGRATIHGKIAALLELGAGFNPELSGMENIFFQGAISGMTRNEMAEKVSSIIDFAEIGEFINQPVKTYSSGMFARLAFSIAISVDPDILIVDEALSVGDINFQAKCMLRMKKMMDSGVTLFFVSHDPSSVKGLCNKAIWLEKGKIVEFGPSKDVVNRYLGNVHILNNETLKGVTSQGLLVNQSILPNINSRDEGEVKVSLTDEVEWTKTHNRYGSGGARILDVKLLDLQKFEVSELEVEQDFIIQVSLRFDEPFNHFCVGYSFRDLKGQQLVGALNVSDAPVDIGEIIVVEIKGQNKLKAGIYTVSVGLEIPILINQQHIFVDIIEDVLVFKSNFEPDSSKWFPSLVKVPVTFTVHRMKRK